MVNGRSPIAPSVKAMLKSAVTSKEAYVKVGAAQKTRKRGMFRIFFICLFLSAVMATSADAENAPGVTDSEIKIGQTMPYSGPASRFSALGRAAIAYLKKINDQGGVNGRKINLISVDDGYLPWRTGNETRRLIEIERVAFIFGSIGTPTQLLVAKYLNERKIPQLFIDSGAEIPDCIVELYW